MSSRHRKGRDRDRSRSRDRGRSKDRERSRDPVRSRDKSKDRRERSRDRSRDRRSRRDRSRSRGRRSRSRDGKSRDRRSRSRKRSKDSRDGTIALLDQMVGTTTTTSVRQLNGGTPAVNPATQAAILAAAAVAQRRIPAPMQPAAAAAAALSAATAIPPPSSVQQKLDLMQARKGYEEFRPASDTGYNSDGNSNEMMTMMDNSESERRRRKRSRWAGSENDKTYIPGLPTVLPSSLTKEQEEQYLLQLQIEEVSRKLRSGDLGIPANVEERSPSPEPIYSSDGKRLNTREYRTRRKLEEERHHLIQQMLQINPEFKPPVDYKPPLIRVHDKVMIPQEEHPDINFVGLLIGPRGNTLKSMEKETGAKIIIRGKGSVKEGKVGRKDGQPLPGEDEPLHAYITATNLECVKKAVEKIKEVIRQGVEVPEGQNDLRRMQLRELAQLNGTLREHDGIRCANCGATEHKTWLCPDKPNVTNNIVCSSCGGAGHIARDCRAKRPGHGGPPMQNTNQSKIDEEYMSLMAELGEGPPPPSGGNKMSGNNNGGNIPGLFDTRAHLPALMAPPGIPSSLPPPPTTLVPPPPPRSMQPPPPWLAGQPNSGSCGGNNINTNLPPLMPSNFMPPNNMQDKNMGPPMGMPPPPGNMGMSNMGNMGMGPPPNMNGPPGMFQGGWCPPPPWGPPPPPPPSGFLAPPPPPPPSRN